VNDKKEELMELVSGGVANSLIVINSPLTRVKIQWQSKQKMLQLTF
jgi:hypothetical protein